SIYLVRTDENKLYVFATAIAAFGGALGPYQDQLDALDLTGKEVTSITGGVHDFEVIIAGATPPPSNHAPVAVDDAYAVTTGQTLSVDSKGVLANDTDADGDTLSVTGNTDPAHGTVTVSSD